MQGLNQSFIFVAVKLLELQTYFMTAARGIALVALTIAIGMAALNYAMTGTGLKESIIKILKAVVFYGIVLLAYPNIINWVTRTTFEWGSESTASVRSTIASDTSHIRNVAETRRMEDRRETFGDVAIGSVPNYFGSIIAEVPVGGRQYSMVAPAAALQSILLVSGECMRLASEQGTKRILGFGPEIPENMGLQIIGIVTGLFVIVVGCFAIIQYCVAYLEFLFVSSVGIILFPLSLWEGSKFMTEKFIGALVGFFIKLLFCTLCIFVMMWGYLDLAKKFVDQPFAGLADQIVMIVFTCLLFMYICISAPGIAQSLLTGAPSLNAAGAIAAAGTAVGAAATMGGMAVRGGLGLSGGASQVMGNVAGSLAKSGAEGRSTGSTIAHAAGAVAGGVGMSAMNTLRATGGDMARSLVSKTPFSQGANKHSAGQMFLKANQDGTNKSFGQFLKGQAATGAESSMNAAKTAQTVGSAFKKPKEDEPTTLY